MSAAAQNPPLQAWLLARLAFSMLGNAFQRRLIGNAAAMLFIAALLAWMPTRLAHVNIPGWPDPRLFYSVLPIVVTVIALPLYPMQSQLAAMLLVDGPSMPLAAAWESAKRLPGLFALFILCGLPVLVLSVLVVPGVWAMGALAIALPALQIDKLDAVEAMLRALSLSEGYRWQTATPWGLALLAWLLLHLLAFVTATDSDVFPLGIVLHSILFVLFGSWQATYFALVYLKLKNLKL